MRLFLLPISTRRTLIYCEKIQTELHGSKPSLVDRAVNKANETWADWEKAEKGWKKKVTHYGNEVFKRIPFEEWGLKTLPPLSQTNVNRALKDAPLKLLYPGHFLEGSKIPEILKRTATERQGLHKKRMIWSVLAMPLTIPVGLLPVIPNFPFIYLAFRAWSHYKALSGSKYLDTLLEKKLISPTPSTALDELYAAGLIHPTRAQSRQAVVPSRNDSLAIAYAVKEQTNNGAEDVMLLQRWNGKLLAERFHLPEMEVEIERAVEQVEKGIKAKAELEREKREIEKVVTKPSNHGQR